jgi:hypothetical protein
MSATDHRHCGDALTDPQSLAARADSNYFPGQFMTEHVAGGGLQRAVTRRH